MNDLTADLFDAMTAPRIPRGSTLARESLWGATTIAGYMGVSDDFVRKIAEQPGSPIRKRAGRLFTTKTEVIAWLIPGTEEIKKST